MYRILGLFTLVLILSLTTRGQDLTRLRKEKAKEGIQSLYEDGAIVVRLASKAKNIAVLEKSIQYGDFNKRQLKRYQRTLERMIEERDRTNEIILKAFKDSFHFCPVYFIYDTSTHSLKNSIEDSHFLDWVDGKIQRVADIKCEENPLFLVYYQIAGQDYPFDVFRIEGLQNKIDSPFPQHVAVRSSFMTNSKEMLIAKAVDRLDNNFKKFYLKSIKKHKTEHPNKSEVPPLD